MTEKLMEYLTHPIQSRLIIDVMAQGKTTAKTLASMNKNIPQATLYRYLKKMVADGVLEIAGERKVRNVTEKIYAMGIDFPAYTEKMLRENAGETYLGMFQQFTIGLLNAFSAYCASDNIDLLNDGSGFRVTSIYASLSELKELSGKIQALIAPYQNREAAPMRKAHSIAVIITPPSVDAE